MKQTNLSDLRGKATAASSALYVAQLAGQYPAELVAASNEAWRAYRYAVSMAQGYFAGPSEAQQLGFSSL